MQQQYRILFLLFSLLPLFSVSHSQAQTGDQTSLAQKVRGRVLDAESRQPLPGVVITLLPDRKAGTVTDDKGYFVLDQVPVGRRTFQFTLMGYDPYTVPEAMVISGKELELNILMKESLNQLSEVTVTASKNTTRPQNEFATLSARSISVEETRRYAAAFADPARMVMNFPGVSNNGDMDNSIVVRGNSPKGVLWRLEGIEIPNPNHFGSLGTSGGAISMLNANVLGTSDFYTGAFPAEFGNALSGAFDLSFRNGNTERREHTVQIGALGVELATEGPFREGKKSSYLINYRYSTLALLGRFLNLGGVQPEYQDASFKLNFPTEKAGTFSVFGLGGYNFAYQDPPADSARWKEEDVENIRYRSRGTLGVAGVSHQYALDRNSYLRTVVSASYTRYTNSGDTLNPFAGYREDHVMQEKFINTAYRMSVLYNRKLNARHTIRTGVIGHRLAYSMGNSYYIREDNLWKNMLEGDGSTFFYQGYLQWKGRLTERLTLGGGLHASHLALNGKSSLEPRASATYALRQHKFTLATGLHSKPEHISTYFFENTAQGNAVVHPNKNLDLLRAFHSVAGYETALPGKMRFKIEAYYQQLYNIPVEKDSASGFSILNAADIYSLMEAKQPLVSEGTGENYGVDISVERPFSDNYYILATGSLYRSTYKNYKGERYDTRFNRGHQVNLIGGREFRLHSSGRRVLGLNGKLLWSGGMRESPIDMTASVREGQAVYVPGRYYTLQGPAYFRADAGVYYKFNNRRSTHTIQLDIQNLTNRQNYYMSYFDSKSGELKRVNQIGILPNISYRIDFHR